MMTDTFSRDRLPVGHMAAYGFDAEIINCWRETGVAELMPLQMEALTSTALMRGGSVLALAPTSAGKTFVGEMAAVRQWMAGRKAIFLCPTRALVAEQCRRLEQRYGRLGIRVVMATADHTQHDRAIRRGDFDFAVMVYEKLRAFLVTTPDLVFSLGVVVADELQILGDAGRGETADLLLTRLTRAQPGVQVVGLSAVVENGDCLAQWLDAELLVSTERPAELREGIYCREHGVFHYRTGRHGEWIDEPLTGEGAGAGGRCYYSSGTEADGFRRVVELCAALARGGESCLLFVPTRALSRQLCLAVAAELGRGSAGGSAEGGGAWEELRLAEDSLVRRQLLECMPAGVAFHNADLTAELRGLVERCFEAGDIRVMVATPTLAQGVNLRAKNVIQIPLMMRGDGGGATGRMAHVPLSVERYRNQAGRAGRLGSGEAFGRSILVAGGHMEAARLGRAYVQAEPERVARSFPDGGVDQFVLECVHSGMADTFSGIHGALEHTFAWHAGAVTGDGALEDRLGESIRRMLDLQLLDETEGHRLRLTGSGQAMAARGFRAETIGEMMGFCRGWKGRTPGEFEILCACAFTSDGEAFSVSATAAEMRGNLWLRGAREWMSKEQAGWSDELRRLAEPAGGLSQPGHGALKMAVVAREWVTGRATAEVEEGFRMVAGTVTAMAAHMAWLAGGLASCAAAAQCEDDVARAIRRLAERLPQGLSERAGGLAQLHVAGLSRNYLNGLAVEGFDSLEALKGAKAGALETVLPEFLVERLRERLRETTKADAGAAGIKGAGEPEAWSGVAEVDAGMGVEITEAGRAASGGGDELHTERMLAGFEKQRMSYDLVLNPSDPGSVVFHGRRLRLPPKPYALLCLLAQRCGSTVTYGSIDQIVWPDEKVEPQQISAHKSRLTRELGRAATQELAEEAIVTDARYGLRMNLRPERVCVRPHGRAA